MKTKTWIWILAGLLILCGGMALLFGIPKEASQAEIYSEGKLLRTVDLSRDTEFTVETEKGSNTVTVRNGAIAVTKATCPDHHCMARGFCKGGGPIVCLPNKLVIEFVRTDAVDLISG